MKTFELFRLHVTHLSRFSDAQSTIFDLTSPLDRPAILRDALANTVKRRQDVRKGQQWMITNLDELATNEYHFAIGRVRETAEPRVQDERFVEVWAERAEVAEAFLDGTRGLLLVHPTASLDAKPFTVAKYIAQILGESATAEFYKVAITAKRPPVAESFIARLRTAKRVKTFWFTTGRPNPFEAKRIRANSASALEEVDGTSATVTWRGESLDVEKLVEVTEQSAGAGDTVGATIVVEEEQRPFTIQLHQTPLTLRTEPTLTLESRREFLARAAAAFNHAYNVDRGGDSDDT